MANRKILKASDLSGLSIYQDPKRGTIFYDIFTKKGYILTSSDVRTYMIYTSMLPLCAIVAFAAGSFFSLNYAAAFIIFVVLYAAVMILFRVKFFYTLPEATNWKPVKRENLFIWVARNFTRNRLILLILMLVALTILMPIYANMENATGVNLYGSYVVSAVTAIGAIICIISLVIKTKNNY